MAADPQGGATRARSIRWSPALVGLAAFLTASILVPCPIEVAAASPATRVGVFAVAASPKRTVSLSGDGVGRVKFGEAEASAAAALEKLVGKSEGGVRSMKGNCTIDAALYWSNFSAYFFHGEFVGYQTGNNLTAAAEPIFNGATPRGLRVGDSLGEALKLYPGKITTSAENGGVYAIATKTGTIRGYLSMEIKSPPAKNKIVTISGGSVGCPAASPG